MNMSAHSSEHPDAPHPAPDADKPAAAPGKPKRRALVVGVVLLVVGAAAALALRGGDAPSTALPPADVPRLQDGQIVFSDTFRKRVGLTTQQVRSAPLTPSIAAVGMVTFDPRHTARVGTRLRGVVGSLHAYEGDEVRAGQLLAQINSPELGEAQAQVATLKAQLQAAVRRSARVSALAETNLSTAREVEESATERSSYESLLRAAEQRVAALAGGKSDAVRKDSPALGAHVLRSPIAGTVVERHIAQGELVEGDRIAFLVSELSHLWVELDVFERNLSAIHVGDHVDLTALSDHGGPIQGRVAQVGAVIDPATRSAPVRIEIDNAERKLRPGQAVDAVIRAAGAAKRETLLVPLSAVTYVDGAATVFVATGENAVKPTAVQLGTGNGQDREVLSGLSAEQKVVVNGVFEIKGELFR